MMRAQLEEREIARGRCCVRCRDAKLAWYCSPVGQKNEWNEEGPIDPTPCLEEDLNIYSLGHEKTSRFKRLFLIPYPERFFLERARRIELPTPAWEKAAAS